MEHMIEETSIQPRFEFRTFGQHFENEMKRMARLSLPVPEQIWERNSDEVYILSCSNDEYNSKIRDGRMDIKQLIRAIKGLEQWSPLLKAAFPVTDDILSDEIFPALHVTTPRFDKTEYSYFDFIELVKKHQDLQAVRVHKQRFGYLVNNCICETAVVKINGARVYSLSVESTDTGDIVKTLQETGLSVFENINYLQALKRVIGMIDKPLAN